MTTLLETSIFISSDSRTVIPEEPAPFLTHEVMTTITLRHHSNFVSLIVEKPSPESLLFFQSWKSRVGRHYRIFPPLLDHNTQVSLSKCSTEQQHNQSAASEVRLKQSYQQIHKTDYSEFCPSLHLRKHHYIVKRPLSSCFPNSDFDNWPFFKPCKWNR